MWWGWAVRRGLGCVLVLVLGGYAATRPHYGGTLRVAMREVVESPDPPQVGPTLAHLNGAFAITRWEAGRRAVYGADENASGGRPYLDAVDVQMAPAQRE